MGCREPRSSRADVAGATLRPSRHKHMPARMASGFALALLLTLTTTLGGLVPVASAHPTLPSQVVGTRYGPSYSSMRRAVDVSAWPQQRHIWCALAAMDAVINWKR